MANRAEIAVRVIRACQQLGCRAIAVYSDADRNAFHTRVADEAYAIGPAPARDSYLLVASLIDVAQRSGAEAIHPGYGFLSENAELTDACTAAGITLVGPPASATRLVGDKAAARRLASSLGVPVVPGYDGADQSPSVLRDHAEAIGFPLLVKAAEGGGGRGMRIVRKREELNDAVESARREAFQAFGSDTLILERLIDPVRHVEVQILGDLHGAMIHLGERDCSVQRRHQKVVEESPSPAITPVLRDALGSAAVRIARAAGYHNAGTCEFLVNDAGLHFFIEMNARLQVEHPVTEQVTGVDIVQRQIRLAAGEPLGLTQNDIRMRGHAIELRVCAEDPRRGFAPAAGRLDRFEPPSGPGIRNDVGFETGDTVSSYYDSMLGKLIVTGETRASALATARWALERYRVSGLATNLDLLKWVVRHDEFVTGRATTSLLERAWRPSPVTNPGEPQLAAAATFLLDLDGRQESSAPAPRGGGGWRLSRAGVRMALAGTDGWVMVNASRNAVGGESGWVLAVADRTFHTRSHPGGEISVSEGDSTWTLRASRDGAWVVVSDGQTVCRVRPAEPPSAEPQRRAGASPRASGQIVAPMPGRVVKVSVQPGQLVAEHQTLVVIEAMKIEHAIVADRDGVVAVVTCGPGTTVEAGEPLVQLGEALS